MWSSWWPFGPREHAVLTTTAIETWYISVCLVPEDLYAGSWNMNKIKILSRHEAGKQTWNLCSVAWTRHKGALFIDYASIDFPHEL